MSIFVNQLLEEQKTLEEKRGILLERLRGAPLGKLRTSTNRGYTQYYYCPDSGDHDGKYIPTNQKELVRMLAQKEYDKKVLSYIEPRLSYIQKLLTAYTTNDLKEYYYHMNPAKQKWVTPIEPIWEEVVKKWMNIPYTGLPFSPDDPVLLTNKNKIRMRSKSELQLGNYFEDRGIPYKYECPLKLASYGTIYPDFTFLSPYTLQEIYLEHLGIMDSASYSSKTVIKIKCYEKNHIFPGERLILTYETEKCKLDMALVEELTAKYLILPDQKQ